MAKEIAVDYERSFEQFWSEPVDYDQEEGLPT
jgi:hypothetical protein